LGAQGSGLEPIVHRWSRDSHRGPDRGRKVGDSNISFMDSIRRGCCWPLKPRASGGRRYVVRRSTRASALSLIAHIGKNQGIQHPLAERWIDLEAGTLLYQRAAWLYDQKKILRREANAAKYFCAEADIVPLKRSAHPWGLRLCQGVSRRALPARGDFTENSSGVAAVDPVFHCREGSRAAKNRIDSSAAARHGNHALSREICRSFCFTRPCTEKRPDDQRHLRSEIVRSRIPLYRGTVEFERPTKPTDGRGDQQAINGTQHHAAPGCRVLQKRPAHADDPSIWVGPGKSIGARSRQNSMAQMCLTFL